MVWKAISLSLGYIVECQMEGRGVWMEGEGRKQGARLFWLEYTEDILLLPLSVLIRSSRSVVFGTLGIERGFCD